jgi:hypothetical protein
MKRELSSMGKAPVVIVVSLIAILIALVALTMGQTRPQNELQDNVLPSKPTDNSRVRQGTPQECMETDFAGRQKHDVGAMMQITLPDYRDCVKTILGLADKASRTKAGLRDLADAVQKKYGTEKGEAIRKAADKQPDADLIWEQSAGDIRLIFVNGKLDWGKVRCMVDGDRATVSWPGREGQPGGTVKLVKADGKWFETMDGPPEEVAAKSLSE